MLNANAETMTDVPKPPLAAWQPLTTGGIAAFAQAPLGRLLLVEFAVATIAAAGIIWLVARAWFPVIAHAIDQAPTQGTIHQGRLSWTGASPVAMASNPFLSIVVDSDSTGGLGQTADVQWVFGKTRLTFCFLFGCASLEYPASWTVPFNRAELGPWWGAWSPTILAGICLLVLVGLLLTWGVLASLYFIPVRVIAFFLDREIGWAGCWRLASASQMPGALVMVVSTVLYGLQRLNAAGLIVLLGLHLVIGWIYLVLAPARLSRRAESSASGRNPFVPAATPLKSPTPPRKAG
jgi:hypothetical protein